MSDSSREDYAARQLVLVTGMSGAGKSTAARALEDLGWFVMNNLPPHLLVEALGDDSEPDPMRSRGIAVIADVRNAAVLQQLQESRRQLETLGVDIRSLYLEASDEALVRRFESSRRPHPLQDVGRILDSIERERSLLSDMRGSADLVIDTTQLNVHELRRRIEAAFPDESRIQVRATVVSFGFKYGIPVDADLVFDARFLPNPYWVPELRERTGLDASVNDYVVSQDNAPEYLAQMAALVDLVADGYLREGKRYVTIAVGCTGGKHRSVAMAENLSVRLIKQGLETLVAHRDLGRE
ncbi:MAG: RNase adapter RapZ [Actinomycetia bacterium]|nr:RNase adapter RapZ [Actinomycetes bacterium]